MDMEKFVSMVSGGIDSPVATYLVMKKGFECIAVHFDNRPFADDLPLKKTEKILSLLSKKMKSKIKLFIIPHGRNQAEFIRKCERRYICLFCRRIQYRVAERIAEKEGAQFIVTGEALGQKASQTVENLFVIDSAVKIPVVRPLIGMDKDDIIKISRRIGIFEESSISSACCTIVPNQPSTRAILEKIKEEEKKLDIGNLIDIAVESATIKIISQ